MLQKMGLFVGMVVLVGVLGLFTSNQNQNIVTAQSFDRQALLESMVTDTILPLHQELADSALQLEAIAIAFQDNTNEETLLAFQEAWKDTSIAYETIQVYRFQRVMPFLTQIDSNPPNIPFIEGYIDFEPEGSINAEFVASLGSSSKGLPALEFLIFVDDASIILDNVNRLDYAVGVASDIRSVSDELVIQWTPDAGGFADRFLDGDGELSNVRSSISMLTNEIIAELEDVARFWLGNPLGYSDGGEAQPDLVEAPYSQTSIDKLIANLNGVSIALNGYDDDAIALVDLLDFFGAELDGEPMSVVLNEQITLVQEQLIALEMPLQEAVLDDNENVTVAYDDAVRLLQLVKTDMASQLGITVTFSDNDGD